MNGTYLYLPKLCCSPRFIIKSDPQWWFSIEFWHPACIPYKVVDKLWVLQHTLNPLPDWMYPHIERAWFVLVFFGDSILFKLEVVQSGNMNATSRWAQTHLWQPIWSNSEGPAHFIMVWKCETALPLVNASVKEIDHGIDLHFHHRCSQRNLGKLKIFPRLEW